jgi:hypothetical protein
MRLQAFLIFIVCFFTDCNSHSQKQRSLAIPDTVLVSAKNGQRQVYGTHIFMNEPKDFNFDFSTNRFERNDSTYIKAVETPTASYSDKYNRFIQLIKEENINGFRTYYQKEFVLQNKKAIILYGLDKALTTEQIILLFGDEMGSTMLLSRFAVDDQNSKNEILKSLLSVYKADSATLGISSIQNYTIDMLNTEFKYNSTTLQMFFYTLNGLGDPSGKANQDVIIVGQMPPMDNEGLVKEKTHAMIEAWKRNGIEITDYKESKIIIDNRNAYDIIITGKSKDKKVMIYGMTTGNDKSTIFFQGSAYNNFDTYIQQFKQIAQTVRLK